jgi:hypothetical protein
MRHGFRCSSFVPNQSDSVISSSRLVCLEEIHLEIAQLIFTMSQAVELLTPGSDRAC